MWDSLHEEVALPFSGTATKAVLLSSVQKVDLPRVEVPFSSFVELRLAELSTDLCGEVDSDDAALSEDCGPQRGNPLPKPRPRMDAYLVSHNVLTLRHRLSLCL